MRWISLFTGKPTKNKPKRIYSREDVINAMYESGFAVVKGLDLYRQNALEEFFDLQIKYILEEKGPHLIQLLARRGFNLAELISRSHGLSPNQLEQLLTNYYSANTENYNNYYELKQEFDAQLTALRESLLQALT